MNIRSIVRFSVPALLLLTTGLFLHARSEREYRPHAEPLAAFPVAMGSWQGHDIEIRRDVLDILGPGEYLSRFYVNTSLPIGYVDFFIGYFPSQKAGNAAHSPKNCLPGSGWSFVDVRPVELSVAGTAPFKANRAIIQKGLDRQLMYYWYQAHGRKVASEYSAKFYQIADAIRFNRTDGSIIRVITPISADENIGVAEQRANRFIASAVPELSRFIPN